MAEICRPVVHHDALEAVSVGFVASRLVSPYFESVAEFEPTVDLFVLQNVHIEDDALQLQQEDLGLAMDADVLGDGLLAVALVTLVVVDNLLSEVTG